MSTIIKLASQELGIKEISGEEDNPTIVNYAKEAGFDWVNDDETPWCGIFVSWVAKKANLEHSKKSNARSWLSIGKDVRDTPEPGDIVVFWRENLNSWKGHVGIFLGFSSDQKMVFCLGGNQGNSVSIAAYSTKNVLGFRRLTKSTLAQVPDKILKKGDRGNEVRALQEALNTAGFSCGIVDGDFGGKTEAAVKALQALNFKLAVNGEFGTATRDYLISLLTQ